MTDPLHDRPGTFEISCRTPDPEDETIHVVEVESAYRFWLRVVLHVQEWEQDDATFFSLIEMHAVRTQELDLTSEFLYDEEWWDALLDASVEHLALRSQGFRRALEDGRPTFRFAWEIGKIRTIEFAPDGANEA